MRADRLLAWSLLLLAIGTPTFALAAKVAKKQSLFSQGQQAMDELEFVRAAKLFKGAIQTLKPSEMGRGPELDAREALVLALYQSKDIDGAAAEYNALKARFAIFRFAAGRITPETVAAIEERAKSLRPASNEPVAEQAASIPSSVIVVSPGAEPRASQNVSVAPQQLKRPWHWYYLAPLGVGQLLAHSPVRGTLFAVLQVGLIASNIVLAVMFNAIVERDGSSSDPVRGAALQIAMNTTFFAAIAAVVAGTIDGAAFEP